MDITQLNLDKLSTELPLAMRKQLAEKTSLKYTTGKLKGADRAFAEQMFRLLAKDAELTIRRILSESLRYDPHIPHDVALQLAKDVAEVAVPMLESSDVLNDEDLIEIVRSAEDISCQLAVAHRKTLSEALSMALVETGERSVAEIVSSNPGATITDNVVVRATDFFSADGALLSRMLDRTNMSPALAERIINKVADTVKRTVLHKFNISPFRLEDAVQATTEWSTLQMINLTNPKQVNRMVDHLHEHDKLSDSIIIRALCQGNLNFFEAALAKRAEVPRANGRKLILDPGPLGFMALYKAAGMPEGVYEAISTVLRIALEETHYGKVYRSDYQRRLIERIITGGYDMKIDNMPFMMAILGRNMPVSANVH